MFKLMLINAVQDGTEHLADGESVEKPSLSSN